MLSLGIAVAILPWMPEADDQTSVTDMLNGMMATSGDGCVYCGGKGVFIRNPFDDYEDDEQKQVVPATFWVNDLLVPSQIYPDYNWSNPEDVANVHLGGAAYRASVAYVIGSALDTFLPDFDNIQSPDWGWGVFYATDSNAVDMRCRWREEYNGWDCPGAFVDPDSGVTKDDATRPEEYQHVGTGWYGWGNPNAGGGGGGTGPHWGGSDLDQENAPDADGRALTMDYDSQCNWDLSGNGWADWVEHWLANDPHSSGGWASVDQVGCWVNNPRDLINLQNSLYRVYGWSTDMFGTVPIGGNSLIEYWGWNEIPMDRLKLRDPRNWDAVLIHLPAEMYYPSDLHINSQWRLEELLDIWVQQGKLFPGVENAGNRPGSYVVFAREFYQDDGSEAGNWFRWFFCDNWKSPGGKFEILSWSWGNDDGGCIITYGTGANQGSVTADTSGTSVDAGTTMMV